MNTSRLVRKVVTLSAVATFAGVLTSGVAMAWTHDTGEAQVVTGGSWYACGTSYATYAGTNDGRYARWYPAWDFRGRFKFDIQVPCATNDRGKDVKHHVRRTDGTEYQAVTFTQCGRSGWYNLFGDTNWNGDVDRYSRVYFYAYADTVSPNCYTGYNAVTAGKGRTYGEKWDYINDWVCLGGYSGVIGDNATGWTESDIYLYPAVDTTHGNVFNYGGKVPGRVQTGDCNWENKLNWKGNATSYGNCDNCYSYGFAWMYSPGGAGPKFLIGADDDQRTYVNGTLISSGTSCCNRDNFETGGISMPSGWSRILFKVRNGGGGFDGTVSLRNGGDRGWNEGSVTRYSSSYGLGYEQDDWYPRIDVASFYGGSNPQPNGNYYGNNTTVTASGTASGSGPVPFWKVMNFQWGYGISETNYTDVSSSGTSWSHSQSGVTGHRRFHFFSVSKSKRTSFQNSGVSGGWNFADGGPANYVDVYVDNVAPQSPSLSSVTAASTSQINLGWALPLDQGVGIAAGSDEAADETSSSSSNYYRRGDVGVGVYRNGTAIYGWGTGTSVSDTGLSANTQYTYTIAARDNTSQSRGAWANSTGQVGSIARYTLIETPAGLSLAASTTQIDATLTGTLSNLSAGSSGRYIANTTGSSNSGWSSGSTTTSWSSSGLTPNTQYSFSGKARNGDAVETGPVAASKHTLATAPTAGQSISCDKTTGTWIKGGTAITFTNPAGFGVSSHGGSIYKVSKFKYAWNNSSSHTFDGSEAEWGSSTLPQTPNVTGDYYLHLRSVNGDGAVTPTTFTMGPFKVDADAPAAAPAVSATANSNGITINFDPGSDGQSGLAAQPYRVTRATAYDSGDITDTSATDAAGDLSAGDVGSYTITTKDAVGNTSQATITGRVPLSGTAWIYTTGASSMAAPGLIPNVGSPATTGVFAGSNDYRLHGMDRVDGDMLFGPVGTVNTVLDRTAPIRDFAAYGLPNPMVFASSLDGNVYARKYESSAWSQAWIQQAVTAGYQVKVKPGGKLLVALATGPRSGQTRNIVVVGTYDNSLNNSFVAMDMADGLVLWTTTPGNLATVTGSPVIYGNTAYFTSLSFDGSPSIWAVNLTNGAVIWSRGEPGSISAAPALSADGSVIYVGNDSGTMYAFSTANGTSPALWTNALGDGSVFGAPWPFGGTVFVSTSSKVHKLSASSGASEGSPWPVSVSLPSIPVVGASGKLYVGAQNGNIYEIVIATGATKTMSLGAAAGTIGDPVLGTDDGQLYVGAADGRIYKVGTPF